MSLPGNLRDVLELQVQDKDPSRGSTGRPNGTSTWSTVGTVRGDVQEEGSGGNERGGRNRPDETYVVRMHDHPKLSTTARLIWKNGGDQTLRVQSVTRVGDMDRYRDVRCTYTGD